MRKFVQTATAVAMAVMLAGCGGAPTNSLSKAVDAARGTGPSNAAAAPVASRPAPAAVVAKTYPPCSRTLQDNCQGGNVVAKKAAPAAKKL